MSKLYDLFSNPAVESFGRALRYALMTCEDYASLIELEYVETPVEFAESLKKFIRRYDACARRYERETGQRSYRPNEAELDELVRLTEEYKVRTVCSALIAHALVRPAKEE
ncbi:hypothetical protein DRO56_01690 [Candidatus Bathyarchaeota archaeon]|nr:MAG: hypothetical protein DRO56_01690 [Candidatus Bathyarchaeota archaeon]